MSVQRGYILVLLCLLPAAASAQQTTLAVIDLEGIGVSQSEAVALSNRLRNELFRIGSFTVVERGLMEAILAEQDFQQTGCTSNECLVELGRILGVTRMVGGTISRVGTMFSVSARLIAVETGEVLNVSDVDLQGGLEELLTAGMYSVAGALSGVETGRMVSPPTGVVSAASPQRESLSGQSEQPGVTWFAWSTRPELNAWQSRVNLAWRPGSEHGYIHVSLSHPLDRALRIRGRRIRPVLSGGYTGRYDHGSDWEKRCEYVWYASLAARAKWSFKEDRHHLSLYLGPGVGWQKYNGPGFYKQHNLILLVVSGVQLGWRFRGSTALVIDGSLLSTPEFGTTAQLSFGLQGPFLSGGLPGALSLLLSVFRFDS